MKKLYRAIRYSSVYLYMKGYSFVLLELLSQNYFEKKRFKKRTGYDLQLRNPKSFNQKVCWRKINCRDPRLTICADKYAVRGYLTDKLGAQRAEQLLIPLLYETSLPETIPFDALPEEYVVKANHGSGTNIIVEKGAKHNREKIVHACKMWLQLPFGLEKHEWAYRNIDRKIVVEKLIRDKQGNLPIDYKFHMFHGRCELIQVNQGHFADKEGRTLTMYSPDWVKQDVFWEFKSAEPVVAPSNLAEMLGIASDLSEGFDYVRVDLYNVDGQILFGEYTFYPTSGHAKVVPASFDFSLGEKWALSA